MSCEENVQILESFEERVWDQFYSKNCHDPRIVQKWRDGDISFKEACFELGILKEDEEEITFEIASNYLLACK